jgi:hypothetical protein
MKGHVIVRLLLGTGLLAALSGCVETYETLRFRPVDTTSQLTLSGVRVTSGAVGSQGVVVGVTDEHGQIDVKRLKSGQMVTFVKEGYEPATLKLGLGDFVQRSPALDARGIRFSLNDGDAVPVPLHRSGQVVRGSAQK